jgi:hypothetical protein
MTIRLVPPDARVALFFPVDWSVCLGIFNLGVEAAVFGFSGNFSGILPEF